MKNKLILENLEELLNINSPTGNTERAIDFIDKDNDDNNNIDDEDLDGGFKFEEIINNKNDNNNISTAHKMFIAEKNKKRRINK